MKQPCSLFERFSLVFVVYQEDHVLQKTLDKSVSLLSDDHQKIESKFIQIPKEGSNLSELQSESIFLFLAKTRKASSCG